MLILQHRDMTQLLFHGSLILERVFMLKQGKVAFLRRRSVMLQ
jgi:hypothetical protein